jgi:hypothetical protein
MRDAKACKGLGWFVRERETEQPKANFLWGKAVFNPFECVLQAARPSALW